MSKLWMTKDSDGVTQRQKMIDDSKNPEVVKQVLAEIDKFNGDHKKNYEVLRTDFEEVKKLINEKNVDVDPIVKDRLEKFTDAITARQDAMDQDVQKMSAISEDMEKFSERMDKLEVALKRPAGGDMSPEDRAALIKQAQQFEIQCAAMTADGAKWHKFSEKEADVEALKNYMKAFNQMLRSKNDYPERSMTPDLYKSLSVGSDPEGGYTVTPAMSSRIVTRIYEMDPIRELASVETISTGALEMMIDWGQAGFGWEGETETGAQTDTADFKKKRIPVHVIYAKPRATQTLLEDSGINIESWHADHVARRFARGEGAAFVDGDGVGKPRGFLTYDDVTTAGTPEYGKIEQVNMGAAAALTYDGFVDVKFSLVEDMMNNATWLMNRTAVAEAMKLKDGNGLPLWNPGMQQREPGIILGLPVRMSTSMPAVAANALSVALADWSEAYMIVDRLGITVQRDPFTAKPFVEFYTRKRVGGDVINFDAIRIGVVAA